MNRINIDTPTQRLFGSLSFLSEAMISEVLNSIIIPTKIHRGNSLTTIRAIV